MTDWPEVTDEQVRQRVKAKTVTSAVEHARKTAEAMVGQALAGAFRDVDQHDYVEAVLRTAYAVYDGAKSSDGVRQQLTTTDTVPVRQPRDPLAAARPIIARYTVPLA